MLNRKLDSPCQEEHWKHLGKKQWCRLWGEQNKLIRYDAATKQHFHNREVQQISKYLDERAQGQSELVYRRPRLRTIPVSCSCP